MEKKKRKIGRPTTKQGSEIGLFGKVDVVFDREKIGMWTRIGVREIGGKTFFFAIGIT